MRIPDIILWDFDGVILNSMPIRDKGFLHIFRNQEPQLVKQLLEFHHKNGGLSRYVKIRYFYEKLLLQEISDERVNQLAEEFSVIMKKELVNPDLLISDSMKFIEKYHTSKVFHIVSGSEQNELRYLSQELKINHFFQSIHGSPTPKKQLVSDLLDLHKYDRNQCVLIGDSINDYEAAEFNGIDFWSYNNPKISHLGTYINKLEEL